MSQDDLNFIPIDREIMLDPNRVMVCKFTPEGTIDYVNDYFIEVTGYEVHEVIGNSMDSMLHPDMPKTIFNFVRDHVTHGKNIHLLLKDKAKDGRYYWFISDFEFKMDSDNRLVSFLSRRLIPPRVAITELENFYQKLLKIEKNAGLEVATKFFSGFNEENGMSFEEYTNAIILRQRDAMRQSQEFLQIPQDKKEKHKNNSSFFGKLFRK
jgi:PAS domain S-box-containing protein